MTPYVLRFAQFLPRGGIDIPLFRNRNFVLINDRLIFDPNATTKPTFSHGAGPTAVPGRKKKDRLGIDAIHASLNNHWRLTFEKGLNLQSTAS